MLTLPRSSPGIEGRNSPSRKTCWWVDLGTLSSVWPTTRVIRAFGKVDPGSGRGWFLGRSAEDVIGARRVHLLFALDFKCPR